MSSAAHVFRFSLAGLFGAVLFVAFGTAAIRFASPLWAGLTMSLTVPVLFAAVLGALFRLGQARAFWTGMAVCGWGYLVLVLAPWFEAGVGDYLPTSYLLSYAHGEFQVPMVGGDYVVPGGAMTGGMGPGMPGTAGGPGGPGPGMGGGGFVVSTNVGPDLMLVQRTGHALFALLFGFIGGVTAKWFYLTRSALRNLRRYGGDTPMNNEPKKVELKGKAMSSTFGFAGKLTIWMTSTFAPDWFADATNEARNETGHNARRREIIFAVCFAESYLVEWVRDDVLNRDFERLNAFFPPGRKRGVTDKWKEVPKELAKAKLIPAMPDHGGKCWADWLLLVDMRDGLVHARTSRPMEKEEASTEESYTPKAELDRLHAGWAVQIVINLVRNLHLAAGTSAPAWIKEP